MDYAAAKEELLKLFGVGEGGRLYLSVCLASDAGVSCGYPLSVRRWSRIMQTVFPWNNMKVCRESCSSIFFIMS